MKEGEESLLLPDHTEDNVVISGVHVHTNIKEGTSGDLENVCKLKIFQNPSFSDLPTETCYQKNTVDNVLMLKMTPDQVFTE